MLNSCLEPVSFTILVSYVFIFKFIFKQTCENTHFWGEHIPLQAVWPVARGQIRVLSGTHAHGYVYRMVLLLEYESVFLCFVLFFPPETWSALCTRKKWESKLLSKNNFDPVYSLKFWVGTWEASSLLLWIWEGGQTGHFLKYYKISMGSIAALTLCLVLIEWSLKENVKKQKTSDWLPCQSVSVAESFILTWRVGSWFFPLYCCLSICTLSE